MAAGAAGSVTGERLGAGVFTFGAGVDLTARGGGAVSSASRPAPKSPKSSSSATAPGAEDVTTGGSSTVAGGDGTGSGSPNRSASSRSIGSLGAVEDDRSI